MSLPGETTGGAPTITCCDCGTKLSLSVLQSNAGYYVGYSCPNCGPAGRETHYFGTKSEAEKCLSDVLADLSPGDLR